MINKKHCDLIYCNSLKQSKANAKLCLLINNYFKFLFQFQKYFLDYIQKFVNFLNNNVAFPKNAKKYNNNAASAHCVHLQMRRKGLKPLVIRIFRILFCVDCHAFIKARNDDLNKFCNDRKCTVITSDSEVIHY